MYRSARWANEERTAVTVEFENGIVRTVPATDRNADFRRLTKPTADEQRDLGLRPMPIADYVSPPPPDVISPEDFRRRFAEAERTAIRTAARAPGGEALADWIDALWTATKVGLTDPRTIAAVDLLVTLTLITADRRDAILAAPAQSQGLRNDRHLHQAR